MDDIHDEEPKSPRVAEAGVDDDVAPEEHVPEDHDTAEPQRTAHLH